MSVLVAAASWSSAPAWGVEPPKAPKAPVPEGRTVNLRPKFHVGRDTRYQFDLNSANKLKSTITPEIDGDQTLTQSIGLKLHTVEVTEDGATVELIYENVKATLETADFRAAFDSSKPASSRGQQPATTQPGTTRPGRTNTPASGSKPNRTKGTGSDPDMDSLLAQIMQPMVGTKLTMKVDKDGNITSVSGGDSLAGGGGGLEGLLGGLGGSGLGGLGGIGGIGVPTAGKGGGGPMSWVITGPAQKPVVHVGESWTNNDSLSGTPVGGFSMVTKHTCRSANGTSASFVFSGRADAKSLGDSPAILGGFALKESSYGGTYIWDTARGELREMSSTLNTRIEQSAENGGSTQMSAETRMNVRRVD